MPCKNAILIFIVLSTGVWADTATAYLQKGKALAMQGEAMSAAQSLRQARVSGDPALRQMAAFWLDYLETEAGAGPGETQARAAAMFSGGKGSGEAIEFMSGLISGDPLNPVHHETLGTMYASSAPTVRTMMMPGKRFRETVKYQGVPYASKHEGELLKALAQTPGQFRAGYELQIHAMENLALSFYVDALDNYEKWKRHDYPITRSPFYIAYTKYLDLYHEYQEHARLLTIEMEGELEKIKTGRRRLVREHTKYK